MNEYHNHKECLPATTSWLRLPLIYLITMLHCYSVQRLEGCHNLYFKVVHPFALWLSKTGVPVFFFITGFIFFLSKKRYTEKLRTRFHTLFIPYVRTPSNLIILRLTLILNIPALLLFGDWCVRHSYTIKLLPNAAFIVLCVNYPIVVALRKLCIAKYSDASDTVHILLYFTCVFISTALSLSIYHILNRHFPEVKKILSGDR